MKVFRKLFTGAAIAALVLAPLVQASAAVPQVTNVSGMAFPAMQPDLNALINSINTSVNPTTMGSYQNGRNVLDNGSITVTTRGTSAVNCGATSGTGSGVTKGTGYSADGWAGIVNNTNGCQSQVSSSSPPPGFQNFVNLFRNTGAAQNLHCLIQEVPTDRSVPLQGQMAVLSGYQKALAGLSADTGNIVSMYVWTGTGSDEGLGTLASANAPGPGWTGVATPLATGYTITTSWARYQSAPFLIPLGATEIAVGFCFAPSATGAGSTDGMSTTGMQLEASQTVASSYEFKPLMVEQQAAQRRYYVYLEATGPNTPNFTGYCQASNTPTFAVPFPTPMRVAPSIPTSGNSQVLTVGGLDVSIDGASKTGLTGIVAVTSGTTTLFGDIAGTNTCTAGKHVDVSTTAATGIIPFTADF